MAPKSFAHLISHRCNNFCNKEIKSIDKYTNRVYNLNTKKQRNINYVVNKVKEGVISERQDNEQEAVDTDHRVRNGNVAIRGPACVL